MHRPRFFYPDVLDLPLPAGHRFPAGKYRALRERAVAERLLGDASLEPSPPVSRNDLLRAHSAEYVDGVLNGTLDKEVQRRIGLPWSQTLVVRSLAAVGGTVAAARAALSDGISGQLAGGTHHAHREFGSGFCTFNDFAVTALTLRGQGLCNRIAIVDLDVHQGDGNAAILGGEPEVLVVSIHGEKNFPFRKVPSDLDIALPDGTGDLAYLEALDEALAAIDRFKPDLLLYLTGADALASDSLGRLSLSFAGLRERDLSVFRFAHQRSLPISFALGGGYAKPIDDTVEVYVNTLRSVRHVFGF